MSYMVNMSTVITFMYAGTKVGSFPVLDIFISSKVFGFFFLCSFYFVIKIMFASIYISAFYDGCKNHDYHKHLFM